MVALPLLLCVRGEHRYDLYSQVREAGGQGPPQDREGAKGQDREQVEEIDGPGRDNEKNEQEGKGQEEEDFMDPGKNPQFLGRQLGPQKEHDADNHLQGGPGKDGGDDHFAEDPNDNGGQEEPVDDKGDTEDFPRNRPRIRSLYSTRDLLGSASQLGQEGQERAPGSPRRVARWLSAGGGGHLPGRVRSRPGIMVEAMMGCLAGCDLLFFYPFSSSRASFSFSLGLGMRHLSWGFTSGARLRDRDQGRRRMASFWPSGMKGA